MLIVPEATADVEAKIEPQDIDQVRSARRRCCASPPSISARRRRSTARSPACRRSYHRPADRRELLHRAHRALRGEIARLGGLKLVPGMPVEAFIQTGERTVLSYLMKPLTDQLNRAFRGR